MGQAIVKTSRKSWVRHVKLAFRKRRVQVGILLLFWLMMMLLTPTLFGPKVIAKGDVSEFKFIHCDRCRLELPFNKDQVGKRCPKCQAPKTGFMVASVDSVKSSTGSLSPWRWVYAGMFVETLAILGGLVYLLYLPVKDLTQTFYVLSCPHCNQRLRYRAVSLGGLGSCSRCKRMVRFPEEEDAILETDQLQADEAAARVEA